MGTLRQAAVRVASLLLVALVACQMPEEPAKKKQEKSLPPATPSALSGDASAVVSWEPVRGAKGYNLYWSMASNLTTETGFKVAGVTSPYTLLGLANTVPYYVLITSFGDAGESDPSGITSVIPMVTAPGATTRPGTPSQISVVSGDGQLNLSWPSVQGAVGYNVYWSLTAGVTVGTANKVAAVNPSVVISNVKNGLPVFFVVTATNAAGESGVSKELTAVPGVGGLGSPTGFSVIAGSGLNTLSWQAVTGASGYTVYWSNTPGLTTANGSKIENINQTSYTHTGLSDGKTYYYCVTATTGSGESGATTVGAGTPQVPVGGASGVSASVEGTTAKISWQPVSGAVSYNLYWALTPGVSPSNATKISNISSTTYSHVGLLPASTYYYILTSVAESKESLPSVPVAVTIPTSIPQNVTVASGGTGQLAIQWSAVDGATSYNLYWSTNIGVTPQTGTKVSGLTSTAFSHGGVTPGAIYYYVVTSVGSGGESAPSAQASGSTASQAPPPPTGVRVVAGRNQNVLTWTQVPEAAGYNVYWSKNFGVSPSNGTKVSGVLMNLYSHTGLSNGETVYYVVTAVGPGGESSPTTQVSSATTPLSPAGLTVTPSQGQSLLSWPSVAGATSYNLYYSTSFIVNPATATKIADIVDTKYVHSGLSSGAVYYYVLTATNGGGESAISNQVVSSIPHPTPGVPSNLTAVASPSMVSLSWGAVPGATSYSVYWSNNPNVSPATGDRIANLPGTSFSHLGLNGGTAYFYVVTATTLGGESAPSPQASAVPTILPPTAPNLTGATAGVQTVTLTWNQVSGATGYNVYWSNVSGFLKETGTKVPNIGTTSFSHTGLVAGKTYYYLVTASGAGGESPSSQQGIATVPYPPTAQPTGLTVVPSSGRMTLTWNPVEGATGYNVYWSNAASVAPGNAYKIAISASTAGYNHVGLPAGGAFYYVVSAMSPAGESSPSSIGSGVVPYTAPDSPNGLLVSAGIGSAQVSWQSVPGATSYNLYWATTPGVTPGTGNKIAGISGTSYSHIGLTQGIAYYYTVTAVNAGGESEGALARSVVTLVSPGAPGGLVATAGVENVTLTWPQVQGAMTYTLYWSTRANVAPGNGSKIEGLTATTYTQTGLTSGTTYYYTVTATGSGGESGPSTVVSATAKFPLPGAPSNVLVAPGVGRLDLSWQPVHGATSYNVYWASTQGVTTGNGIQLAGITKNSYSHTGLTQGGTYFYVVSAVGPGGESATSAEVSGTTLMASQTPIGVEVTSGVHSNTVTWQSVAGATSYNVYWSESPSLSVGNSYKVQVTGDTTFAHTGLNSGVIYYYMVTSVGPGGESAPSNPASGKVDYPVPGAPAGLTVIPGVGSESLSWEAVDGATSYNVYWSTSPGITSKNGIPVTGLKKTSFVHTGLTQGIVYYYVVTAVSGGGESEDSAIGNAVTLQAVGAPSGLTVVPGVGSNNVSWSGVPGATSYTLYWSTSQSVAPGNGNKLSGLVGTNYVHQNLTSGTTLYYVITAVSTGGESSASSTVSGVPRFEAPDTPNGVSVLAGPGQVKLGWNTAKGATSYNVYWQTTPGVTAATGTRLNSIRGNEYVHSGLAQGVTYYYVITAEGPGGESVASASVSATTLYRAVPPDDLAATGDVGSVVLGWSPVPGATSYNLYWSTRSTVTPGDGYKVGVPSGNTYSHSNLQPGQTYYYVITSVTSAGESVPSSVVAGGAGYPIPTAPTGLTATAGVGTVALSWPSSPKAVWYNLYWATTPGVTPGNGNKISSIQGTTYEASNLGAIPYYYVVTAATPGGESPPSSQAMVTPLYKPGVPTSVAVTPEIGQNVLSWNPVAGALSYTVYWSPSATVGVGDGNRIAGIQSPTYTHSGLPSGQTYYYVVCAEGTGGEGPGSSIASGSVKHPLPGAPSNVLGVPGVARVSLSWIASSGASSYNVYWSTTPGLTTSNGTRIAGVRTNSYDATGLLQDQTYYYLVTSQGPGGESAPGTLVATKTLTQPVPPLNLTGSSEVGSASLSWSAASGASSYTVYWSTSPQVAPGNGTRISGISATSYQVSPLVSGETYYFVVTSVGAGGESDPSAVVSVQIRSPAPATPMGVSAGAGYNSNTISWVPTVGATSYTLYWATKAGVTKANSTPIGGIKGSAYTHSGLTYGIPYYYMVTASGVGGESGMSSETQATPLQPPLSTPVNVSVTPAIGSATVSWGAVAGSQNYTLYYSQTPLVGPGNGNQAVSSISGTSFTVTGLTSGATYYFAVTSNNGTNVSPPSSAVSTTVLYPAPPAVTGLAASVGVGSISLSWASAGALRLVNSYTVYWATTPGPGPGSNSFEVTGGATVPTVVQLPGPAGLTSLSQGVPYYFNIVARGDGGTGPLAATAVKATPLWRPEAPKNLTVTSPVAGQLELGWSSIVAPSGLNVTYNVYYSTDSNLVQGVSSFKGLVSTAITIPNLVSGATYYVAVTATGDAEGPKSSVLNKVVAYPRTVTPSSVSISAASTPFGASAAGPITVSWSGVAGATSYNIYYGPDLSVSNVRTVVGYGSTPPPTAYQITDAIQGKLYYVSVTAVGPGPESLPTTQITVMSKVAPPSPPTGLTVSTRLDPNQGNTGTQTVSWGAVPGAKWYHLYYANGNNVSVGSANVVNVSVNGSIATVFTAPDFTGLVNGATYSYVVTADNTDATIGGGESGASVVVRAAVPAKPSAPVPKITLIRGIGSISVTWEPPATSGSFASPSSYNVYQSTSVPGPGNYGQKIANTGSTGINTIGGLDGNTRYYYTVVSLNSVGDESTPLTASAHPLLAPPNPPTFSVTNSLGADNSATQTVTWNAVPNATSYQIYWGTTPGVGKGNGALYRYTVNNPGQTSFSWSNTGLSNKAAFYYVMTASNDNPNNGAGEGPGTLGTPSAYVTLMKPPPVPNAPSVGTGVGSISASWSVPADGSLSPAAAYRVYWGPSDGSAPQQVTTVYSNSFSASGVDPNRSYSFRVSSLNADNPPTESGLSGVGSGTPKYPIPGIPSVSTLVGPGPGEIAVSWSGSTDTTAVRIVYSTDLGSMANAQEYATGGLTGSLTRSDLTYGVPYYFKAIATNRDNWAESPTVTGYVKLPLPPMPPTLVPIYPSEFTGGGTIIRLEIPYNPPAGVTQTIYYDEKPLRTDRYSGTPSNRDIRLDNSRGDFQLLKRWRVVYTNSSGTVIGPLNPYYMYYNFNQKQYYD